MQLDYSNSNFCSHIWKLDQQLRLFSKDYLSQWRFLLVIWRKNYPMLWVRPH